MKRRLKVFSLVLSIALHCAAFLQFQLQEIQYLPERWTIQFIFLLSVSAGITLLLPLCAKPVAVWSCLTIRAIILWIIGLPLGSYLSIELLLLGGLIVETIVHTSLSSGLYFSLGLLAIMLASQRPFMIWQTNIPGPSVPGKFFFLAYSLLTIGLSFFLRYQTDHQISSTELNNRLREATLNLTEVNVKLQDYIISAAEKVKEEERKRLAREIHDTLANTLVNLIIMYEVAIDLSDPDNRRLIEHLKRMRGQAKNGLFEVRRALHSLRPKELKKVTGIRAINRLVKSYTKATHLKIVLSLGDVPLTLGKEVDLTAFRLVQEGITNAIRHGLADEIYISLSKQMEGVNIWVKDNGIGTNVINEGYGLTGMRERLEKFRGKLEVSSKSGEGFILSAWLPLREGADHDQEDKTIVGG